MKDYSGRSIFANYFVGKEAVGGKIYFDNNGFLFKSHDLNIQTGSIRIEYSQIIRADKRMTLGIVPNGMSVFTFDNFEHKFVIYHRNSVIEYINSRIG